MPAEGSARYYVFLTYFPILPLSNHGMVVEEERIQRVLTRDSNR